MRLRDLCEQVFEHAKRLVADGFVHGAQGNISALERNEQLVAITPSAADVDLIGSRKPL